MIQPILYRIYCLFLGTIFLAPLALQAQTAYPDRPSQEQADSIITEKVFYVLQAMQTEPWAPVFAGDSVLNRLKNVYSRRSQNALQSCKQVACLSQALQWKDSEVAEVSQRLKTLYTTHPEWRELATALRDSHRYQISNARSDTALIRKAWEEAARGINHVIGVYLGGEPARYPAIDSIAFNVHDGNYLPHVRKTLSHLNSFNAGENVLFFDSALQLALEVLKMNGRDEAARYEPLTQGLNLAACQRTQKIDWGQYTYSALLVPGFGPESAGIQIDHRSIARCEWAAEVFKQGKAPFIIVSGGHVYPHKTPYSEAVEMRRYLIDKLGIAEEYIMIEPHARHTTTNIRNAVRLVYRMNMPTDKPVLVITDDDQRKMIENLDSRCMRELGFVPYKNVKTISDHQIEFYPVIEAFQANTMDVLDP